METHKTYSKEFKENAVNLCEIGNPASQVARELGINESMLRRWRNHYKERGEYRFPGIGMVSLTPQEREKAELLKTIKRLEIENAILKKAMSIVSKSDL